MADFFTSVKNWFKELAEWVQENLGDPYIVEALRDDVGLAAGADISEAQRDRSSSLPMAWTRTKSSPKRLKT